MTHAERIKEIEDRAAKATAGPWLRFVEDAQGPCMVLHPTRQGIAIASLTDTFKPANGFHDDWYDDRSGPVTIAERNANTTFIAHSRDDIPWLLSTLRAVEADNARLRALLEEIAATCRREPKPDQSDEYLAAYFESHTEIILGLTVEALQDPRP